MPIIINLYLVEENERQANAAYTTKQNKSAKSTNKNMTWNDMRSRQTLPVNASRRVSANNSGKGDKPLFKISK